MCLLAMAQLMGYSLKFSSEMFPESATRYNKLRKKLQNDRLGC